eukprot:m.288511 g.288511  ORF g.288511 m.288511 type:complete len:620 (+) comp40706_c0_seq67:5442-7301(+)
MHMNMYCPILNKDREFIKWTKDNETFTEGKVILTIHAAQAIDSGRYRCFQNHTIISSYLLLVKDLPIVLPLADSVEVLAGKTAVLGCNIGGLSSARWLKDNLVVQNQPRFTAVALGAIRKLFIRKVVSSDAGTYECQGVDAYISRKATIRLEILFPAVITSKPASVLTYSGMNVTLKCLSEGYPNPETFWYNSRQDLVGKSSVLELINVMEKDAGIYKCIVNNSISDDSALASVAAKVETDYVSVKYYDFKKIVTLLFELPPIVNVTHTGELKWIIYFNGTEIVRSEKTSRGSRYALSPVGAVNREVALIIQGAQQQDGGIYTGEIVNQGSNVVAVVDNKLRATKGAKVEFRKFQASLLVDKIFFSWTLLNVNANGFLKGFRLKFYQFDPRSGESEVVSSRRLSSSRRNATFAIESWNSNCFIYGAELKPIVSQGISSAVDVSTDDNLEETVEYFCRREKQCSTISRLCVVKSKPGIQLKMRRNNCGFSGLSNETIATFVKEALKDEFEHFQKSRVGIEVEDLIQSSDNSTLIFRGIVNHLRHRKALEAIHAVSSMLQTNGTLETRICAFKILEDCSPIYYKNSRLLECQLDRNLRNRAEESNVTLFFVCMFLLAVTLF